LANSAAIDGARPDGASFLTPFTRTTFDRLMAARSTPEGASAARAAASSATMLFNLMVL